jgi:hypothetical protein
MNDHEMSREQSVSDSICAPIHRAVQEEGDSFTCLQWNNQGTYNDVINKWYVRRQNRLSGYFTVNIRKCYLLFEIPCMYLRKGDTEWHWKSGHCAFPSHLERPGFKYWPGNMDHDTVFVVFPFDTHYTKHRFRSRRIQKVNTVGL